VGKLHAAQRFASGFKIGQLVAEYRALRASVLHLWEKNAAQDPRGITRFNEAIDEALTESVNFFADSMTQLRDRFIGVLGHDLRNPLVAIILGSSMMVEAEGISDKNSGMAARILGSARRMQRLVSGLHDLTRTRFGDLVSINPGHMDFAEVCRQVIAEFEVIVPEKKLNFSAKGNLKGIWDPFRLAQVMSNLIDNAVKYGSPRQGIDISVEEQGAEVVVKVHNRGNPIPSEAQGTIFEPMVTLEQPEKGMRRGLGLGLYIVAQIMLAHGGSVAVSSTRKEGTTFTLRLPRGG
jgi:signal transduction histidine kinase